MSLSCSATVPGIGAAAHSTQPRAVAGSATCSITTPSAVATVARRRTPTSTPTREPGSATPGCWGRWTSTRTLASRRVPLRRTEIASTRARPARMRRSMRRVFSWVRTVPITGSVRWRRSGSTRIAPVVKHTRSASRPLRLNRGNPTRLPARLPAPGVSASSSRRPPRR